MTTLQNTLAAFNNTLPVKTANETNLGFQTINTNNGTPNGKMTIENLASQVETLRPEMLDGVFVVTCESDGFPRWRKANQATQFASSAVGVGVRLPNGRMMMIARDSLGNMKWATSNTAGGTTYVGREAACMDFDGKTKTTTITNTLGDAAIAAKACREYATPTSVPGSTTANYTNNFGAGKWWLPSFGECITIWENLNKINVVLKAIGGDLIPTSGLLWSSSELSAPIAWSITLGAGNFSITAKAYEFLVRPVSAFM